MPSYVVARTEELPDGARKIVELEGRSIGVFNVGGRYFAVRNTCPHQSGPLCLGYQTGLLEAQRPGEFHYSRRGEMLRCPWHGWEFDLRTGHSWVEPTRLRVRSYDTGVSSGAALLARAETETEADPESGAGPLEQTDERGRVRGPYAAQTFPVSVEHDYVVVQV